MVMAGHSTNAQGNFTYDGLVSAQRSGGLSYKARLRWKSTTPTGPDGEVRAFVLAAAANVRTSVGSRRRAAGGFTDDDFEESETWEGEQADRLLEASVATDESDYPVAWVGTCPNVPQPATRLECSPPSWPLLSPCSTIIMTIIAIIIPIVPTAAVRM